jgi:calcium-dependent protein kinase
MTTHLISQEETKELEKTFEAMDINKDGRLSRQEILSGYTVIYGADLAEVETQRIMEVADIDNNGTIDYTEFINATLDKNKVMTHERLRMAFDFFDKVI